MVLHIKLPKIWNREISYEISDIYVMVTAFLVSYWSAFLIRDVIRNYGKKNQVSKRTIQIPNPKGGGWLKEVENIIEENNEVCQAIIFCIENNKTYRVLDERVLNLVIKAAYGKLAGNDVLIISQNLIRLFARVSYNSDPSLLVKIGQLIVSTPNKSLFVYRTVSAMIVGVMAQLTGLMGYGVLFLAILFNETSYVPCNKYFEELPASSKIIDVVAERDTDKVLIISDNTREVAVYVPNPHASSAKIIKDEITNTYKREQTLKKVRKKTKLVKFEDFKRRDPVLSRFGDIVEPEEKQRPQLEIDLNTLE